MGSEPGKRTKLRQAFDAHYPAVSRYCHRRLPAEDANEAAAQIFVVAWKKIDKMPDGESTLPWLYAIARYEVSTARRRARRRGRLLSKLSGLGSATGEDLEDRVAQRLDASEIHDALSRLSERDQEAIRLRSLEELSLAEVAAVVGCSEEAAKKRCARALSRLRRALEAATSSRRSRASEEWS